jgi:hypothetical protein
MGLIIGNSYGIGFRQGSYLNPDRITEEDTTLYLTEEDSNEQIISED